MSQSVISPSPDLKRLQDEGYDIEVLDRHLFVRRVPYVSPSRQVQYGTLVEALNLASPSRVGSPNDHTIYFQGETPCDYKGQPLVSLINNSTPRKIGNILVHHYFSCKANNRDYANYYDKISKYCEILSAHAKEINNSVTEKPNNNEQPL
jgi:hypothetical protein